MEIWRDRFVNIGKYIDDRGTLSVVEGNRSIPFKVKRVFWITDVPENEKRGGHAHAKNRQVIFAAKGSFWIRVEKVSPQIQIEDGFTSSNMIFTWAGPRPEESVQDYSTTNIFQRTDVFAMSLNGDQGFLVEPGEFVYLYGFSPDAVCLVLCSEHYDKHDYLYQKEDVPSEKYTVYATSSVPAVETPA